MFLIKRRKTYAVKNDDARGENGRRISKKTGNKDKDDMGVGFDGSRGSRFGRGHDDARCG